MRGLRSRGRAAKNTGCCHTAGCSFHSLASANTSSSVATAGGRAAEAHRKQSDKEGQLLEVRTVAQQALTNVQARAGTEFANASSLKGSSLSLCRETQETVSKALLH